MVEEVIGEGAETPRGTVATACQARRAIGTCSADIGMTLAAVDEHWAEYDNLLSDSATYARAARTGSPADIIELRRQRLDFDKDNDNMNSANTYYQTVSAATETVMTAINTQIMHLEAASNRLGGRTTGGGCVGGGRKRMTTTEVTAGPVRAMEIGARDIIYTKNDVQPGIQTLEDTKLRKSSMGLVGL